MIIDDEKSCSLAVNVNPKDKAVNSSLDLFLKQTIYFVLLMK